MGRARIRFTAEVLPLALHLIPSTYRLLASEASPIDGVIVLIFSSEEVVEGATIDLFPTVTDVGSTRTVVMERA